MVCAYARTCGWKWSYIYTYNLAYYTYMYSNLYTHNIK